MVLQIKKLVLLNNIIAAPLAGFTDAAWRILARQLGAGLVFSEMISVGSVLYTKDRWKQYAENDDRARPFGLQLFGTNPDWFVRALDIIGDAPFDLLDINMGCPVKKVVSGGAGSALMKSPETVEKILGSVTKAYHGPLTVKIRSGWDKNSINVVEIAKIAEGSGVDAVIVHPRTRSQGFAGSADWSVIRDVKNEVSIPVIGNGDVVDRESAMRMFDETGCDGIMIGRAAIGRPWIFGEIQGRDADFIFSIVRQHIELVRQFKDDCAVLNMMKKFIPKYFKGWRGVHQLSKEINIAKDLDVALKSLEAYESSYRARCHSDPEQSKGEESPV